RDSRAGIGDAIEINHDLNSLNRRPALLDGLLDFVERPRLFFAFDQVEAIHGNAITAEHDYAENFAIFGVLFSGLRPFLFGGAVAVGPAAVALARAAAEEAQAAAAEAAATRAEHPQPDRHPQRQASESAEHSQYARGRFPSYRQLTDQSDNPAGAE